MGESKAVESKMAKSLRIIEERKEKMRHSIQNQIGNCNKRISLSKEMIVKRSTVYEDRIKAEEAKRGLLEADLAILNNGVNE